MKTHRMLLLVLLGVLAIAAVSACHPKNVWQSHFGDPEEIAAHRMEYVRDRLTRALDLNAAQQARVAAMAEALHSKMAEIRKDREKGKAEVIAMIERENLDARDIDDFMVRKLERLEPVRRLFAENLAAFHAMLTPGQREKLAAEIRDHKPGSCPFRAKW